MTVVVGIFAMEYTQEPSGAWWVLTTSRDEALVLASPRAAWQRVNLRLYLALQPFWGQGYPHSQQGATSLQIGQANRGTVRSKTGLGLFTRLGWRQT